MEKIIHQIWIGPYKIPKKESIFVKKVKSLNSDFTHVFWDEVPKLPYELQKLVDYYTSIKQWINICDLIRYHIVNEHGGIYIDCDYEPINPIKKLRLHEYDGFLPLHYNPGETICCSLFGFNKNHPIINAVCEKMKKLDPEYNHWLGPNFFGTAIKEYLGYNDSDTDVIIDPALSLQGIKTMHSRGELKTKFLYHHLSYTWNIDNQNKLELK